MNVDVTVYLDGFHGDCSETILIGSSHPTEVVEFVEAARFASFSTFLNSFSAYNFVDYILDFWDRELLVSAFTPLFIPSKKFQTIRCVQFQ